MQLSALLKTGSASAPTKGCPFIRGQTPHAGLDANLAGNSFKIPDDFNWQMPTDPLKDKEFTPLIFHLRPDLSQSGTPGGTSESNLRAMVYEARTL